MTTLATPKDTLDQLRAERDELHRRILATLAKARALDAEIVAIAARRTSLQADHAALAAELGNSKHPLARHARREEVAAKAIALGARMLADDGTAALRAELSAHAEFFAAAATGHLTEARTCARLMRYNNRGMGPACRVADDIEAELAVVDRLRGLDRAETIYSRTLPSIDALVEAGANLCAPPVCATAN